MNRSLDDYTVSEIETVLAKLDLLGVRMDEDMVLSLMMSFTGSWLVLGIRLRKFGWVFLNSMGVGR